MQRARTTLFYYFIFSYLILHAFYFEGMPRETNKGWGGGGLCTPISLPPLLSSYTEKRSKRQLYMSLDEMNTKRTEYKPESSASQSVETKARVTCTRHSRGDASARIPPPLCECWVHEIFTISRSFVVSPNLHSFGLHAGGSEIRRECFYSEILVRKCEMY